MLSTRLDWLRGGAGPGLDGGAHRVSPAAFAVRARALAVGLPACARRCGALPPPSPTLLRGKRNNALRCWDAQCPASAHCLRAKTTCIRRPKRQHIQALCTLVLQCFACALALCLGAAAQHGARLLARRKGNRCAHRCVHSGYYNGSIQEKRAHHAGKTRAHTQNAAKHRLPRDDARRQVGSPRRRTAATISSNTTCYRLNAVCPRLRIAV